MNPILLQILTTLVYLVFKILGLTYRCRFHNRELIDRAALHHPGKAYIIGLWHQNIFAALQVEDRKHLVLISPSKDGEFVAVTCKKLGHEAVRGSSNKRASEAMNEMGKLMNQGIPAAISIDGPRGPKYDVKAGIIEIARRTGGMVVPMSPIPEKYWEFKKAWDQFRVPKPFTKITVVYGEPFAVPPETTGEDFEAMRVRLKQALFDTEKKARELMGQV